MKRNLWVIVLVVMCLSVDLKAQTAKSFPQSAIQEPFQLEVAFSKTTHLVFPFSIISVDRGSASILVQKAAGVENILKVKADQKGFEETSLSVITSDGTLYSFLVCYKDNPAYLNINLATASMQPFIKHSSEKSSTVASDAMLVHYAAVARNAERNIRGLKDKEAKVCLIVEGLYVKESAMFLRLRLQNQSAINYDIDQLRLYLRDKEQSKRTAVQEKEVMPLLIEGNTAGIKAKDTQTIVLALPKFTIPNGKYLALEMTEVNGGRNLYLRLKNKHVLKARPLD